MLKTPQFMERKTIINRETDAGVQNVCSSKIINWTKITDDTNCKRDWIQEPSIIRNCETYLTVRKKTSGRVITHIFAPVYTYIYEYIHIFIYLIEGKKCINCKGTLLTKDFKTAQGIFLSSPLLGTAQQV